MSAITINLSDEIKKEAERAAKGMHLPLAEFIELTLLRPLARSIKDPRLEKRAKKATGTGWEEIKKHIPKRPPIPDDE